MKVAVVGATGLVGTKMLEILAERNFPVTELIPVASAKSVGKEVFFNGSNHTIIGMETAINLKPDIAIFSAGGSTSREWAPKFEAIGTIVIDNSSAWRMDADKKLVVPEVNGNALSKEDMIIANPNCSTIQMVMALSPLHKKYGIKRLIISTYQSVSGTGVKAVNQLTSERIGEDSEKAYPYPIDLNCLPHAGDFDDDGYTSEEIKLVDETRKILNSPDIQITATVVRVPVIDCHSMNVNIEFESDFSLEEVKDILSNSEGLQLTDEPKNNKYPMPLFCANDDLVHIGRVRKDLSIPKGLNMWIVSDNLRKGAATNAIQIAEYLIDHKLLPPMIDAKKVFQ